MNKTIKDGTLSKKIAELVSAAVTELSQEITSMVTAHVYNAMVNDQQAIASKSKSKSKTKRRSVAVVANTPIEPRPDPKSEFLQRNGTAVSVGAPRPLADEWPSASDLNEQYEGFPASKGW